MSELQYVNESFVLSLLRVTWLLLNEWRMSVKCTHAALIPLRRKRGKYHSKSFTFHWTERFKFKIFQNYETADNDLDNDTFETKQHFRSYVVLQIYWDSSTRIRFPWDSIQLFYIERKAFVDCMWWHQHVNRWFGRPWGPMSKVICDHIHRCHEYKLRELG